MDNFNTKMSTAPNQLETQEMTQHGQGRPGSRWYDNWNEAPDSSEMVTSPAEIYREVEAEINLMVKAVEAELKKDAENSKLEGNLQELKHLQDKLKRQSEEPDSKAKFQSAMDAVSTVKKLDMPAYEELKRLQSLAMEASSNQEKFSEFRQEARLYLQKITAGDSSLKGTADRIIDGIKPVDKDDHIPNLGFWNTLLFRTQLFFQRKDANWAFDYLLKTKQFIDNPQAIIAYLEKNCKGLVLKHHEQYLKLKKRFEPLPEQIKVTNEEPTDKLEIEDKIDPKIESTSEPLPKPATVVTEPVTKPEVRLASRITQVERTSEALEMLGREEGIDGLDKVQEVSKQIIETIKTEEAKTSTKGKLRYAANIITEQMIQKNIPFTDAQIDSVFKEIGLLEGRDLGSRDDPDNRELTILSGALKDFNHERTAQAETLRQWYVGAKAEVDAEANLTDGERGQLIEKQLSRRFINNILAFQQEKKIFTSREGKNIGEYDDKGTTALLTSAVDRGAIKFAFHEDAYGKRIPTLTVEDLVLEDGKVISSKLLMNLINGANSVQLDKSIRDPNTPSPTGLFIQLNKQMPGLVCIDLTAINNARNNLGTPVSPQFRERLISHEIMHAYNWGVKEAKKAALTQRLMQGTLNGVWVNKLVDKVSLEVGSQEIFKDMPPELLQQEIRSQLESYIRNEASSGQTADVIYRIFDLEGKTASILKLYNKDLQEDLYWGNETDEITAEAIDMTAPLTLADIGLSKEAFYSKKESEQRSILGMIRIINSLKEMEEQATDEKTKSKLDNDIFLFAKYLGGVKSDGRMLEKLIRTALEDENHPLHRTFSNFKDKDILFSLLNNALDEDSELGLMYDLGGLFKASNNDSSLRWAATRHKDAFYFGSKGTKGRMGGGPLGAKLDIFSPVAWLHSKDKGPALLQIPSAAISKKNFMDGFGIGLNQFKLDSSDGLEAISFLTGIPVHRLPFLQNLPNWLEEKTNGKIDLDQSDWRPEGLFYGSPDMYVYYVQKVMYGRLGAEHKVDNQSLIKLLPEIGGYDYDMQGSPVETIYSYARRGDQYRLNNELADFIMDKLVHTGKGPNRAGTGFPMQRDQDGNLIPVPLVDSNRDDLREIADRLRTDILYHRGAFREVTYRDGYVLTKDFADSLPSGVQVDAFLATLDETTRAQTKRDGIVRKGQLRMGQMSQNALKEITEITYIPANDKPGSVLNPFGLAAKAQVGELKAGKRNNGRLNAYEKIGNLMMIEDARRRESEDGSYTLTDLYEEMSRAQMQPWPELFKDGEENKDAVDRYLNPKMLIGGEYVDLNTVKEFFRDYSMSRAHKVLAVGVWGREADYDTTAPEDLFDSAEVVEIDLGTSKQHLTMKQIKNNWSSGQGKELLEGFGFQEVPIPELPEGMKGYYFTRKEGAKDQLYFLEITTRMGDVELAKSLRKVESLKQNYSQDAKLKIENKATGYTLDIDPVRNLSLTELIRYFGEKSPYKIHYKDKNGNIVAREVNGRKKYDTQYGCMYDDVLDELDKIQKGRTLSYRYSVKLNQISSYREHSKVHREFYEGLMMIDNTTRFFILAGTVIGSLVPSLVFMANPYLIIGTIAMALTVNPFLNRYAKGWGAREIAAIQEQGSLSDMAGLFWGLTNEKQPPSYGQLDLANGTFEGIKFKYRSVLKNFGEASYNSNFWTDTFLDLWGRVSSKPY